MISRWFTLYMFSSWLDVHGSAVELAMETSRVDSVVYVGSKIDEAFSANLKTLRAVELEIGAVTSAVEQFKNSRRNEDTLFDRDHRKRQRTSESDEVYQDSPNSLTLQHALAANRLESLMKARAQLENDVSVSSKDNLHCKLIRDVVKDDSTSKQLLREVVKTSKDKNKRFKSVSFIEDDDFETVLTTATSGFVETERDESIRKGLLTPFHKLKGFERCIQEPGSSNRQTTNENMEENSDFASSSIARAVRSMSEAAQARPTSMLLDPEMLPRLDAPSHPFQRLRKPLKVPRSLENGTKKDRDTKKKRRPQPGKKWRKMISHDDENLQGDREDTKNISNEEPKFDNEELNNEGASFVTLEGGLKIPETIFGELFEYQKIGVQWLWELHCQRVGGIIGDEMGLGKTVQVLSFLGSLHFSGLYKPSVVICPVTLLQQWKREARRWVTSLLDIEWGYAVLDEGHRIRNPNAEITLVCKQLQTVHRIIMTGAPIQNKLSELWSLFDFVFPGKLGVLPVFEAEFAAPISVGGYANATPLQVSTAFRCAVVLRDLVMPYLLRRMKADVDAQLPKKTEHVLFCSLTPEQRSMYRAFLASSEVEQIFDGSRNSLYGIDVMRKICNHPDLLEREHSHTNPDYGNPKRSGKMNVVAQVLKLWKEQGHRVLIFAQTQQMLDILENFLSADGYNYRRMDGLTPVQQRMALIDEFNNSDDVFIFILTTKVGGLGTNLTGANRVIIFDPDWNPSTDMQARERAWRIGQKKDVTVYRLITRGTIEEKVYHRQIYKHFLTNKILQNPQQRRFFKSRDMKDLFTLNEGEERNTETSTIFSQLAEEINVVGAENKGTNKSKFVELKSDTDGLSIDRAHNSVSNKMEEGSADHNRGKTDDETGFLMSLFDAHGIHSAVNHDAIMNAHNEEKMKLEAHAAQVARRASEALRQSRMLRSLDSITVPTWTGKSGSAGAPLSSRGKFGSTVNSRLVSTSKPTEEVPITKSSRPNGFVAGALSGKALSSAELLERIKGNQEQAINDGIEHQIRLASSTTRREQSSGNGTSRSSNSLVVQPEVLIRQICTFIQQKGGRIDSASIVDHFKLRIPSKDLPLFKNLLKEIAILEKNSSGSNWVLKPEYQDQ
ncbi:DNA repair protein rhp26-like [Dorcoceras hygrometricum]|uniref:DNA repair protein rhp26-like n=1 Tax=Dorcoceras hygrometricum TaxID=472368 RepID=A0A2Z7AM66_9LAMI|nr:DNA repair protein rhp26-like [Dorcoceras hygrometricum]